MDYVKDDKIAQRLSMLYANYEALNNLYYALYYKNEDEDFYINQYDDDAEIKSTKIPSFNKFLNDSVKHGTVDPTGTVTGAVSDIYINTANKSVWVCITAGTSGWFEVLTSLELEDHNYSEIAHPNVIARYSGSSSNVFNTRSLNTVTCGDLFDSNLYNALTRNYIGDTPLLTTETKTNLVEAINEIYTEYLIAEETGTYLNEALEGTVYSGHLLNGDANIINLNFSTKQDNVSTGITYVSVFANESVVIELVGGGGELAVTFGNEAGYTDTLEGWKYWHEGGSGGYFKGTFIAPRAGLIQLVTPNAGGEDAVAYFISAGYETVELARAKGGSSGYPVIPALFSSEVAGGIVTYNSTYISNVEASLQGASGKLYKTEYLGV